MSRDRLITNKDKKSWRCGSFTPYAERAGYAKYADYAGHTMYAGYEGFPKILPLSHSYATIQVFVVGDTVSRRKDIKVKIYKNWCKRCGICIAFCPEKALEADQDGYPSLKDNKTCTGCGLCELLCPDFAILVNYDENRVPSRK